MNTLPNSAIEEGITPSKNALLGLGAGLMLATSTLGCAQNSSTARHPETSHAPTHQVDEGGHKEDHPVLELAAGVTAEINRKTGHPDVGGVVETIIPLVHNETGSVGPKIVFKIMTDTRGMVAYVVEGGAEAALNLGKVGSEKSRIKFMLPVSVTSGYTTEVHGEEKEGFGVIGVETGVKAERKGWFVSLTGGAAIKMHTEPHEQTLPNGVGTFTIGTNL